MAIMPANILNQLLRLLPPTALARIAAKLHPVAMPARLCFHREAAQIDTVYFPETGMISLVANLRSGTLAEIGVIGREGMLGISLLSGLDISFCEALVQLAGTALRMDAADFRHQIETNEPFRLCMLRYNEALHTQVMQTAACNGHHGLEQRLARWLLMAHDRSDGIEIPLTQEGIAMILGARRPSVTVIAGQMQRAGILRYMSGRITILDRPALEAASCECYVAASQSFLMLLGPNSFTYL